MFNLKTGYSGNVIERIGAINEGVLRNERQCPEGRIRDAVVYSILDREWEMLKENLNQLLRSY